MSVKSAVVIGRLLDAEGFDEHVAGKVTQYAKRNLMDDGKSAEYDQHEAQFRLIVNSLSDNDKQVIGKFINHHKKFAFDTGLRVGLAAFSVGCDGANDND